jgi:hypothetical protein
MDAKPQHQPTSPVPQQLAALLASARATIDAAAVCGEISVSPAMLSAEAVGSALPAMYRLMWEGGKLWVALQTPERYLSQSIEADLLHTGDSMNELIDEELVELGIDAGIGVVEHFRSQDKLYTFRSVVPVNIAGDAIAEGTKAGRYLLAYEACFRNLGDMQADEE